MDSLLETAIQGALTGHQYSNIAIRGQAQTGNMYSSDWEGGPIGAFHKYDNIQVEVGGKGLIMNKYGGKDFWGRLSIFVIIARLLKELCLDVELQARSFTFALCLERLGWFVLTRSNN